MPDTLEPFGNPDYKSFYRFIQSIVTPPLLVLPKYGLPYSIYMYSSYYQVSTALFQIHPYGERRPIVFWSDYLCLAENNHSTFDTEFLTVVWAIHTFLYYLQGVPFVFYSDHSALRWLM